MARQRLVRNTVILQLGLLAGTFIVIGLVLGMTSFSTTADVQSFIQNGLSFLRP